MTDRLPIACQVRSDCVRPSIGVVVDVNGEWPIHYCDDHEPLHVLLERFRAEVLAGLMALLGPLLAWLVRVLPEPKWLSIGTPKGWRRWCPHGLLGWSYQRPSRMRRWCRVCAHGEVRRR